MPCALGFPASQTQDSSLVLIPIICSDHQPPAITVPSHPQALPGRERTIQEVERGCPGLTWFRTGVTPPPHRPGSFSPALLVHFVPDGKFPSLLPNWAPGQTLDRDPQEVLQAPSQSSMLQGWYLVPILTPQQGKAERDRELRGTPELWKGVLGWCRVSVF